MVHNRNRWEVDRWTLTPENPYKPTVIDDRIPYAQPGTPIRPFGIISSLFVTTILSAAAFVVPLVTVFGPSLEYWPGYLSAYLAIMVAVSTQLFFYRAHLNRLARIGIFVAFAAVAGMALVLSYFYWCYLPGFP